ncbi:MAG TPA: hypothetical protein VM366_13605 [Anaerolineae bacterium]|nr:hypothetical protein [Anaerolineae bacterium]
MSKQALWVPQLLAATAVLTWVLANGMDVLSMLFAMQLGGGFAFASARFRPAELFLIYAGFRLLGTIAVGLFVLFVLKYWPAVRSAAWSALTAFALVAALVAWWRLHQ